MRLDKSYSILIKPHFMPHFMPHFLHFPHFSAFFSNPGDRIRPPPPLVYTRKDVNMDCRNMQRGWGQELEFFVIV